MKGAFVTLAILVVVASWFLSLPPEGVAAYMPHGHCYYGQPWVTWLNMIGNIGVFGAYMAIPSALVFLGRREPLKSAIASSPAVFALFAALFLSCGVGHALAAEGIRNGEVYPVATAVLALTAIVSIAAAVVLPGAGAAILDDYDERQHRLELTKRQFDESFDLYGLVDVGTFQWYAVNKGWERTLGYTVEEIEAIEDFRELWHPEDRVASEQVQKTSVEEGEPANGFINRFRHKNGGYRHIEWRGTAVGGTIYATGRDVTDLIRRERELAALAEHMENFAYAAAHDLRAPLRRAGQLATSAGYALAPLEKQGIDVAKIQLRLDQIQEEGRRGVAIVDAALDYAKAGGVLELTEQYIEPAISAAVEGVGPNLLFKLYVKGDPSLRGRFHAKSLTAVVSNLLDNAGKYAEGGNVTVGWGAMPGGGVFVVVDDDGMGFDPEVAASLTEPARKAHPGMPGFGFGLAKSKRLAESMGGKLTAASPGEGHGASFLVELPG